MELRSMMRGYIQDATQSEVPNITLLNRMMEDIEKYKATDPKQASHDVACCDEDNPCECGMEGKSMFSKINKPSKCKCGKTKDSGGSCDGSHMKTCEKTSTTAIVKENINKLFTTGTGLAITIMTAIFCYLCIEPLMNDTYNFLRVTGMVIIGGGGSGLILMIILKKLMKMN